MSNYVVDTSVVVKWFIEEKFTENALNLLKPGNKLHAPDFLMLEIDAVLCKWIRRGIIKDKEADRIRSSLADIPIEKHSFTHLLDSAYSIANLTNQTPYDCLYVALAVHLGEKMVTADRKLYNGLSDTSFRSNLMWIKQIV